MTRLIALSLVVSVCIAALYELVPHDRLAPIQAPPDTVSVGAEDVKIGAVQSIGYTIDYGQFFVGSYTFTLFPPSETPGTPDVNPIAYAGVTDGAFMYTGPGSSHVTLNGMPRVGTWGVRLSLRDDQDQEVNAAVDTFEVTENALPADPELPTPSADGTERKEDDVNFLPLASQMEFNDGPIVEKVLFDVTENSSVANAHSIRMSRDEPIRSEVHGEDYEWLRAQQVYNPETEQYETVGDSRHVAYSQGTTKPKVRVWFVPEDPQGTNEYEVWAVNASTDASAAALGDLDKVTIDATDNNGGAGYVFEFTGSIATSAALGNELLRLVWWRHDIGDPQAERLLTFDGQNPSDPGPATTVHPLMIFLDRTGGNCFSPWDPADPVRHGSDPIVRQKYIPWVEVAYHVLSVVSGKTCEPGVLAALESDLFENAGAIYDVANGASQYLLQPRDMGTTGDPPVETVLYFRHKAMMDDWRGGVFGGADGSARFAVACYDMALGLAALANVVGAEASVAYVDNWGPVLSGQLVGWADRGNNPFFYHGGVHFGNRSLERRFGGSNVSSGTISLWRSRAVQAHRDCLTEDYIGSNPLLFTGSHDEYLGDAVAGLVGEVVDSKNPSTVILHENALLGAGQKAYVRSFFGNHMFAVDRQQRVYDSCMMQPETANDDSPTAPLIFAGSLAIGANHYNAHARDTNNASQTATASGAWYMRAVSTELAAPPQD